MAKIENVRLTLARSSLGQQPGETGQQGRISVTHWGGRDDGADMEISEVDPNIGPRGLARMLMPAEQVRELIVALAETIPEDERVTLAAQVAGITLHGE